VGHTDAQRSDAESADSSAVRTLGSSKPLRPDVKTIDLPPSFQRHLQQPGEATVLEGLAPAQSSTEGSDASANIGSLADQPASDGSSEVITLDNDGLQRLSESQATAPMSTKVIDHRTRT